MNDNNPETIDGGAPYEFDPEGVVPEMVEAERVRLSNIIAEDEDPNKGLRDLVPDAHTDGGVTFRSAESGQYVTHSEAEAHPDTTVKETRPAKMSKKRTVMTLNAEMAAEVGVPFCTYKEDGTIHEVYFMDRDLWDDFGAPDVITLAVVPRDILN